jgi:phosphoribosylglycinamide formyltransferase 2
VILGGVDARAVIYEGLDKALADSDVSVRLFGKPESYTYRRMGVALATAATIDDARVKACDAAKHIIIKPAD